MATNWEMVGATTKPDRFKFFSENPSPGATVIGTREPSRRLISAQTSFSFVSLPLPQSPVFINVNTQSVRISVLKKICRAEFIFAPLGNVASQKQIAEDFFLSKLPN